MAFILQIQFVGFLPVILSFICWLPLKKVSKLSPLFAGRDDFRFLITIYTRACIPSLTLFPWKTVVPKYPKYSYIFNCHLMKYQPVLWITHENTHVYMIILCIPQLPPLTTDIHKMKTPHASHGILETNYKSPPCLIYISPNILWKNPLPITMTEELPYFVVKFKIKCPPLSWLSIAFSDTVLMLQFCLPYCRKAMQGFVTTNWLAALVTALDFLLYKAATDICYRRNLFSHRTLTWISSWTL